MQCVATSAEDGVVFSLHGAPPRSQLAGPVQLLAAWQALLQTEPLRACPKPTAGTNSVLSFRPLPYRCLHRLL